ncbi:hypothetical protein DFH28DRAFT_1121576 [Melampsora americana]|nr:hypothetical protein DFH28DRAFT_1121576 [Melampsora americana]
MTSPQIQYCDNVALWGVTAPHQEECWICRDYPCHPCASPRTLRYLRRQKRTSVRGSSVYSGSGSDQSSDVSAKRSAGVVRQRARLDEYNRQAQLAKAKRAIVVSIQNKRRDSFRGLREALVLVATYNGPFLQSKGDKARAALFLRNHGLARLFISNWAEDVKWQWIDNQVATRVTVN